MPIFLFWAVLITENYPTLFFFTGFIRLVGTRLLSLILLMPLIKFYWKVIRCPIWLKMEYGRWYFCPTPPKRIIDERSPSFYFKQIWYSFRGRMKSLWIPVTTHLPNWDSWLTFMKNDMGRFSRRTYWGDTTCIQVRSVCIVK